MHSSKQQLYPPLLNRIFSVWFRHYLVYSRNIISNGLPPFLEPLIFLAGIGLGMKQYVGQMGGLSYITFLATGLPITAAMFTSAFECSYGTFIRLEFDKVYEGMLAAPLSASNVLIGEILWIKGIFLFSCSGDRSFGIWNRAPALEFFNTTCRADYWHNVRSYRAACNLICIKYQSFQFFLHRLSFTDVFLFRCSISHR
jgi:hypothetical protein